MRLTIIVDDNKLEVDVQDREEAQKYVTLMLEKIPAKEGRTLVKFDAGPKRIQVVKAIRTARLDMSLGAAKTAMEAGCVEVPSSKAEAFIHELLQVGAVLQ